MPSSSPHAFRYEPALCTLAEGQTLSDWRRADAPPKPGRRPRGRVLKRRGAVRRPSSG